MTADVRSLFQSFSYGPLQLKNRIVMAPMTRSRASFGGDVSAYAAQYYAQRASAGLIVAEAVMMAAAPALGRQRAHDVVYAACRDALARDLPLAAAIADIPELVEALGGAEAVAARCDPANYLGLAPAMVDRLLAGRA